MHREQGGQDSAETAFYRNPNFRITVPGQSYPAGEHTGPQEQLNEKFFAAIETMLIDTDWYSTREALGAQLKYAEALAKIGEPARAEAHFDNVMRQIDEGRGSRRDGQIDDDVSLVSPTQYCRDQAIWYARTAKHLGDAGFIELADRAFGLAKGALQTALDVPDDQIPGDDHFEHLGRDARESNAALEVIAAFLELEQYDTAGRLISQTGPTPHNYLDFLPVIKRFAEHYEGIGEEEAARNFRNSITSIVEEIYDQLAEQFAEATDSHLAARPGLSYLVEAATTYEVGVDILGLLTEAQRIVDRHTDTQVRTTEYCWLAKLRHKAGDSAGAFQLLQDAIAGEHRTSFDNPEYFEAYSPTDFSEIAEAYADIGAYDHSEVFLEQAPRDLRIYILLAQLEHAVEADDEAIIAKVAPQLEAELAENFADTQLLEETNPQAIELLAAYIKRDDRESMVRWSARIAEAQEDIFYGIESGEVESLVEDMYKKDLTMESFELAKFLTPGASAHFLAMVLEDVNTKKTWETHADELSFIAARLEARATL